MNCLDYTHTGAYNHVKGDPIGGGIRTGGIERIIYRANRLYWDEKEKEESMWWESLTPEMRIKINTEIASLEPAVNMGIALSITTRQIFNDKREAIIEKYRK